MRFEEWLEKDLKPDKNHSISVEYGYVKAFNLADVQWHDPHNVTAHGILLLWTKKMIAEGQDQQAFSWTRNAEWKDDGVDRWWTTAGDPTFQYLLLTKDQREHMSLQYIVRPNLDGGGDNISPLAR